MTIFGISLKGQLVTNIRVLAVPVLLSFLLIIISVLIFKNGVSRIYDQLDKLEEVQNTVSTLQEKVDVLRSIEGIVLAQADISVVSLPDKNPSMITLSQLERLAQAKEVEIVDKSTRIQQSNISSLSSAGIDLEINGQMQNILDYFQEVNTLAPLSTLGEVNITGEGDTFTATTNLAVFWGSYPTKIPPITEPIKTLTQKEENLLDNLARLVKPELVELNAQAPTQRENPFQ